MRAPFFPLILMCFQLAPSVRRQSLCDYVAIVTGGTLHSLHSPARTVCVSGSAAMQAEWTLKIHVFNLFSVI